LDVCLLGSINNYIALVGSNHIAQDTETEGFSTDEDAYPAYRL
jgi:hypothetical protein